MYLFLHEKKVPKLCVSVFFAWRQRSARRMESWHVHTACGRVQMSMVSLYSLSVEDRGTKGTIKHHQPVTSLLNAKRINQPSSQAAKSTFTELPEAGPVLGGRKMQSKKMKKSASQRSPICSRLFDMLMVNAFTRQNSFSLYKYISTCMWQMMSCQGVCLPAN